MMDALVILWADNRHTFPPILAIISFRSFSLLLAEFRERLSCQIWEKRERRNMDLWLQFKWRGNTFPGNIKLEVVIQASRSYSSYSAFSWKAGLRRKMWSQYLPKNIQGKPFQCSCEINEKWHKDIFYFTECQVSQEPKSFGIIHCEHGLSRGLCELRKEAFIGHVWLIRKQLRMSGRA